jgi:prolyl-tRNA synthetase
MVGATIMAHGDDSGLVLPPNVAPTQLIIVPIFRTEVDRVAVASAIELLEASFGDVQTASGPLRHKVDWSDGSPGFKFNHWELRGVPLRLEIGPRDVAAGQAVIVRRLDRAKETLPLEAIAADLPGRLSAYQAALFQRALDFRTANTHEVDTYDDFKAAVEGPGGFLMAPWCGSAECEQQINSDTGATIRCIPFDSADEQGACIIDGKPSERRVLFARAY